MQLTSSVSVTVCQRLKICVPL